MPSQRVFVQRLVLPAIFRDATVGLSYDTTTLALPHATRYATIHFVILLKVNSKPQPSRLQKSRIRVDTNSESRPRNQVELRETRIENRPARHSRKLPTHATSHRKKICKLVQQQVDRSFQFERRRIHLSTSSFFILRRQQRQQGPPCPLSIDLFYLYIANHKRCNSQHRPSFSRCRYWRQRSS